MKSNNFICVVFLLMILFAVTSVGGCGGSNGSLESSTDENPGGNQNETVEYSVLDEDVLDSDGDGVPDILDFKEVEEFFYEKDYCFTHSNFDDYDNIYCRRAARDDG